MRQRAEGYEQSQRRMNDQSASSHAAKTTSSGHDKISKIATAMMLGYARVGYYWDWDTSERRRRALRPIPAVIRLSGLTTVAHPLVGVMRISGFVAKFRMSKSERFSTPRFTQPANRTVAQA